MIVFSLRSLVLTDHLSTTSSSRPELLSFYHFLFYQGMSFLGDKIGQAMEGKLDVLKGVGNISLHFTNSSIRSWPGTVACLKTRRQERGMGLGELL